jgi:hypothetical protein
VQGVAKSKKHVAFFDADLSSAQGVESLIHATKKTLGSIDIMVNNAGIQHVSPVEGFPTDKWNAIINVNLSAAFHATRLVLPDMRTRRWGRIINIASVHGLVASAHKAAYVAAKHGVIGLTKVRFLFACHRFFFFFFFFFFLFSNNQNFRLSRWSVHPLLVLLVRQFVRDGFAHPWLSSRFLLGQKFVFAFSLFDFFFVVMAFGRHLGERLSRSKSC